MNWFSIGDQKLEKVFRDLVGVSVDWYRMEVVIIVQIEYLVADILDIIRVRV